MLGFVKALKEKLAKTKNNFIGKIAETIRLRGKVDEELMEELEEILIRSDIGVQMSMEIIDRLRTEVRLHKMTDVNEVQVSLQQIMADVMLEDYADTEEEVATPKPKIMLFVGVNGVGKTTTIGKLAKRYKEEGKSVLLVAGDTFRAAAVEQLTIWADRANVPIVKQHQGADPAAVVFDGVQAAISRGVDIVMIDTAGRQHTKVNLMNELGKMTRSIQKLINNGPHETILVVDSTTGQNAITQAKMFNEVAKLSGIALTKLDGTAKGGIVLSIKHELQIPVKFIGVGEGIDDLRDFEVKEFVDAMFLKGADDEEPEQGEGIE